MKLTTTILAVGMMASGAWAQNPNVINNVQSTMNSVQQQKTNDSNAALGIKNAPAPVATKPVAGAPAKAAGTPAPGAAKNAPAPAAATAKTQVASQTKPAAKKTTATAKPTAAAKSTIAAKKAAPKQSAKSDKKTVISAAPKGKVETKPAEGASSAEAKSAEAPKPPKPEEKKWAMNGKRDPFFSPVVQQPTGSGCSTGKKCLEIGSINLHGVVKSDSGFIAVVTNNLGKAYFLRENDPVFNGYVMRITGDTVVFEETFQDKLGKPLTREVVKRITTPAV
jgi:Tfp pilus assembly protein PilP